MLIWSEKYSTGVEAIDRQHRLLFDHINRLEEILSTPQPTAAEIEFTDTLVQFVESYAETHFKFEESCMERYRCPAHARNQAAHAQFLEFVAGFTRNFPTDGDRMTALHGLHQFLSRWLTDHILQTDTELRDCIKPPA